MALKRSSVRFRLAPPPSKILGNSRDTEGLSTPLFGFTRTPKKYPHKPHEGTSEGFVLGGGYALTRARVAGKPSVLRAACRGELRGGR
jgi:hypothetical protein